MEPPLAPGSPTAIALHAIVSGLERVELEFRRLEAERVRLLGEAMELAGIESEYARSPHAAAPELHAPRGTRGELAYRAIRAEIATALRLSERTVDRHLSQAHALVRDYPSVHRALADGEVSARQAAVILDAGAPIAAGAVAGAVPGALPDALTERAAEDGPGEDDANAEESSAADPTANDRGEGAASEAGIRERRHAYAEAALAAATDRTPAELAVQAKRLAERYAAVPLEARHAVARRRRRVWVVDREDGMADLTAFVPAAEAYAIRDRLTRMARAVADTERAEKAMPRRYRDEIRADIFTDVLLGGTPEGGGTAADDGVAERVGRASSRVRAVVHVIVPAHALTGKAPAAGTLPVAGIFPTDAPLTADAPLTGAPFDAADRGREAGDDVPGAGAASSAGAAPSAGAASGDDEHAPRARPELPELLGYGPIDATTARRLAGEAEVWELIREHPSTGAILSADRYRPTEQMRRLLRARDQHCRFPGCRVPVHHCDLDHTVDAALGGPTATDNLAHLCRGHHTLKHHTGWWVRQARPGVLVWTAPTGRVHVSRPPRQDELRRDPPSPDRPHPGRSRAAAPSRVRFRTPQESAAAPQEPAATPQGSEATRRESEASPPY